MFHLRMLTFCLIFLFSIPPINATEPDTSPYVNDVVFFSEEEQPEKQSTTTPETKSEVTDEKTITEPMSGLYPADVGPFVEMASIRPPVLPRFSVRHDFGDGVGYQNGFTYVEGFLPVWEIPGRRVVYGDARIVNFDHSEFWEFNLGGGYRSYNCCTNRVFGFNMFYDGRNSDLNYYSQIGFGLESLGEWVDVRLNGYLPVGNDESLAGFNNPKFKGSNIELDRIEELALAGFDLEVGVAVPYLQRFDTKAFLGYYFYTHNAMKRDAHGVSGRLESIINERMSLHFSVNHDDVFGTTLNGGLAMHFGGGRWRWGRMFRGNSVQQRLGNRVVRDPNIVLSREFVGRELALGADGNPLRVVHVASGAAAGGDGSINNPFATLTQAQNNSAPGNIIFAHSGSEFIGEGITLKPHQQFLGEGIPHLFQAMQGTFLLPSATGGMSRPVIRNAPTNAVTLADNSEVSGFYTHASGVNGVNGVNVKNINVNRNIIHAAKLDGINVGGTMDGKVTDNTVYGNGNFGIAFAGPVTGIVAGNMVGGNQIGLNFQGVVSGTVAKNTVAGNLNLGMAFFNTISGTISENNVQGTFSGSGILVAGAMNGTFSKNSSNNNNLNGYEFIGVVNGLVDGNFAITNAGTGFNFANINAPATVSDNIANSNQGMGYIAAITNPSATIQNNSGTGNLGGGNFLPNQP